MTHHLNPHQQLAVNHIEGPLLVLAGAGSGKTRIITHRIVHLLNIGVPAGDILAVTFTNKAADEMRHRIKQLSYQSILTCTFHSLGAKILRESIHLLGFKNMFSIYDEDDSISLLKTCMKTLGVEDDKAKAKTLKHAISQAKNELKAPESLVQTSDMNHQEFLLFKNIYTMYQQKLKEYNALDFDDLLFLTVHLLKSSEPAREYYQKKWSFVLIDEYQDTNAAQYALTRLLVNKHHNLFVVGDPDQSIYSWRGANINNILNFEVDFPNAKVIKLEQNYRSTNHILSAANSLIQQNENRYEKNLWSSLGDGEKVQIISCENEYEESSYVIKKILEHHKSYPYEKMVIFYRTNAQSRVYEDALLRQKIPYVIVGGISFYQRREIKDILSFLRIALLDADYISFARTINTPKRGLGPAALEKFKIYSEQLSMPIMQLCKHLVSSHGLMGEIKLSAKQLQGLKEYLHVIEGIQQGASKKFPLKEILKSTIENSCYLTYLKEDKETYDDRKANLDELITKAAEWELENENPSLSLFLEELSLRSSSEEKKGYEDSIKLMTLHNGKGLEFDVTFIVGLEEDLLPHVNCKDSPEAIEEERRLLYVGMTRARKHLHLTSSSYRMIWGIPRTMQQSRFLEEIDASFVETQKEKSFTRPIRSQPTIKEKELDISSDPEEFKVGSIVFHKDFGKGVVQKSYNTSLGKTYDVLFTDSRMTKSLVAKFAKLKSF